MNLNPSYLVRLILALALLGAVVIFGGRIFAKVAKKVPV